MYHTWRVIVDPDGATSWVIDDKVGCGFYHGSEGGQEYPSVMDVYTISREGDSTKPPHPWCEHLNGVI